MVRSSWFELVRTGFDALHRLHDGSDVIGRRAAAAAHDRGQAGRRELADELAGLGRLLVVLTEGIRQAGVGIGAHPAVGDRSKLREMRAHLARTERAVHADAERLDVLDRQIERVDGLTRERPPAAIGDGHGDHHWRGLGPGTRGLGETLLEDFLNRDERRFRVERVEDRLDEEDVDAAVEQAAHLLRVGVAHLIEGHGAERRVVDVWGDRQRPVRRAEGAGDEARLVGRLRGPGVRRLARETRPGDVQRVDGVFRLERVVRLRDGLRVERVGLDDVGAGLARTSTKGTNCSHGLGLPCVGVAMASRLGNPTSQTPNPKSKLIMNRATGGKPNEGTPA